jgi:hypothetical protein
VDTIKFQTTEKLCEHVENMYEKLIPNRGKMLFKSSESLHLAKENLMGIEQSIRCNLLSLLQNFRVRFL